MKRLIILLIMIFCIRSPADARVDLVTLPGRDTVQLTIYNSADLTLVRESRALTLKKGLNKLQFSWANTLIDPTSLEMLPRAEADKIDIFNLSFPPSITHMGIFQIQSQISGTAPVEITYLTSGLSWRAFYMATLSTDESKMKLDGYVRVSNNSGENYDNAQIRLIVGKINLLDEIVDLANRKYPYKRPGPEPSIGADQYEGRQVRRVFEKATRAVAAESKVKEIQKEGISEYYLYTIEGRESIRDKWSKRLPSFDIDRIPVKNLYKFDQDRFGNQPVRFLIFKNDTAHHLGQTPIPEGDLKIFRIVDNENHFSYEGQCRCRYIPVDQQSELNLGSVENVIVEPVLMKYESDNYTFYKDGNISGWDEVHWFEVNIKNTRDIPVTIEIIRNFSSGKWKLENRGDFGNYEIVDKDTVKYTLEVNGNSEKKFSYDVRTYHGQRAELKTNG
jgi:hypothetical protein